MEVTNAFLADFANIDAGGKINALGIFTQIAAPEYPTELTEKSFVLIFDTAGYDILKRPPMRIRIFGGDEPTEYLDHTQPMEIPEPQDGSEILSAQMIAKLGGLVLQSPGTYSIEIYVDEILLKTLKFRALVRQRPTNNAIDSNA